MTTPRQEYEGEISINGFQYPVKGPLRRFLASTPTPRMVVGESGAVHHQGLSHVQWDDWRGGIGIERMNPSTDGNRAWWSTCTLRQKRHLTLPALATTTAASGVAGSFSVGGLGTLNNAVYAAFGAAVRAYTAATDSWGATLRTLASGPTSIINARLANVNYILFAYGTGYDYFDGTTWATSTRDAQYLVYWDDRVWGIDSTGQLWWATTLGTETLDAQLPLPNDSVTNLFLGRSPSGDIIIYAATTEGVYAHDSFRQEFVKTELELPRHPDNGLGATTWRDASYISAGMEVFKFQNGANTSIVSVMGLSSDHGLPADYRGRIRQLLPTLNGLIAALDATTAASVTTMFLSEAPTNSAVISPDAGRSAIAEWDGQGWQVLWTSAANTLPVTAVHVSNAYNDYRLWWAQDQRVSWMTLPRDITNPNQISNRNYAASATHETPWFDADEEHASKLALVVCSHAVNASAAETIAIRMRLNDDDTVANQTTVGTITADGHSDFLLPSATNRVGTAWRSLKFVLDLARGATVTLTPDLSRLEFYFERRENVRWGVSALVVIPPEGYNLQSGAAMYENLIAAEELATLVQVTWRDRDADAAGTANPYNYFMRVAQFTGLELSGSNYWGEHQLVLVEKVGN